MSHTVFPHAVGGDSVGDNGRRLLASPSETPPTSRRRGVTMIELLVVIAIMMLLVAIIVPNAQPALEGRRVREAARMFNVYCGRARVKAMETGRPCGIVIRRFGSKPLCSMVIEQAEVPPSYAGDSTDSKARVQLTGFSGGIAVVRAQMSGGFNASLVHRGDLIQFNHQGPLFEIITEPNGGDLTCRVDLREGGRLPYMDLNHPLEVPYEIFRRPVKSLATPLQLPTGAVIDLQHSGSMKFNHEWRDGPIYLMFSPNGSMDRAYHDGQVHQISEPIFMLIGRVENVPDPTGAKVLKNWQDMRHLWVALNPRTGKVTTAELAPYQYNQGSGVYTETSDGLPGNPRGSRYYAAQAQSKGGQ